MNQTPNDSAQWQQLMQMEEAKRRRHQSDADRRVHQDVLLDQLADSPGFRQRSTPKQRKRLEALLNKLHS